MGELPAACSRARCTTAIPFQQLHSSWLPFPAPGAPYRFQILLLAANFLSSRKSGPKGYFSSKIFYSSSPRFWA